MRCYSQLLSTVYKDWYYRQMNYVITRTKSVCYRKCVFITTLYHSSHNLVSGNLYVRFHTVTLILSLYKVSNTPSVSDVHSA